MGLIISIAVGLFHTANGFWPLVAWYGWVKKELEAEGDNLTTYRLAWRVLVWSHLVVFSPVALLWPFTYMGSSVVVEFYDLLNWWIGTLSLSAIVVLVAIFWIIAAAAYKTNATVSKRAIWLELAVYLLLESFGWYAAVFNYPMAHNWYYYSDRVKEAEDKKESIAVDKNGNALDGEDDDDSSDLQ